MSPSPRGTASPAVTAAPRALFRAVIVGSDSCFDTLLRQLSSPMLPAHYHIDKPSSWRPRPSKRCTVWDCIYPPCRVSGEKTPSSLSAHEMFGSRPALIDVLRTCG